jgi:hypothetical protein
MMAGLPKTTSACCSEAGRLAARFFGRGCDVKGDGKMTVAREKIKQNRVLRLPQEI